MANASRRVVVGLDFGTTYSGFAFAHISDPERIYTYFEYPKARGEKPYCKTLTASYYKTAPGENQGRWQLHSWGYPARAEYERDIQAVRKYRNSSSASNDPSTQPTVGKFLSRFKLHLASRQTEASSASPLPPGLTIEEVITDYLRELGGLILKHLQDKYGAHFTQEMIQWCVTVPSIWDNSAKATMKSSMIAAGLVNGVSGSPHPLVIVLEPEAASFHCHKVMCELTLELGNKLLVTDIGGGTSDIVVQEVVSVGKSSYRVKEVTTSSGGLCGGTYVDSRFMELLHRKIGPCLPECILTYPNVYGQLIKQWEFTKCTFGNATMPSESTNIDLPNRLVMEWESCDRRMGNPERQEYDELEISYEEMQSIFDPIVQENLDLIQRQLGQARGAVKVLVLVGGFTESPYLLYRIKQAFSSRVESIVCPPNPGSAICQGAVALAFNPSTIVSRICKKTYGFALTADFENGVDPYEYLETYDGVDHCRYRFEVLVKKGDEIMTDKPIGKICSPRRNAKTILFELFSSEETIPPRYTTGRLVKKEGEIVLDISGDMGKNQYRKMKMSLFFGGSSIEVKAEAVNFMAQPVQLSIEVDYLFN